MSISTRDITHTKLSKFSRPEDSTDSEKFSEFQTASLPEKGCDL